MNMVLLIKFIYRLRIQMKWNMNIILENVDIENLKGSKVLIEYSNNA